MNRKKLIAFAKVFLKIVVSSVALSFVFKAVNLRDIIHLILASSYWLLVPSILLYFFSKYITAIRFQRFLSVIGIAIPGKVNIRLYLLGMFYNLLLPGGVGGDGYKVYYLHKTYKTPLKELISLSIIDRLSGMMAIILLGEICSVLLFFHNTLLLWLSIVSIPITFGLYFLGLYLFNKNYIAVFRKTNFESFAGQFCQVITIVLLLFMFEVKNDYLAYIFIFLVSSIVAAFPFTIGGIGARELTFLLGAEYLALDPSTSVTISLVFYLICVLSSLCGIYYGIFPEKIYSDSTSHISESANFH